MLTVGEGLYGGSFLTLEGPTLPFVLPGEHVDIRSGAELVIELSPDRVEPGCVHFGRCGGCQYQHASYPAQLAVKRSILQRILPTDLPTPIVHADEPWGYRNRIRLRVGRSSEGTLRFGYNLRGTNDFLPITMCPISAPLLWLAAETMLALAGRDPQVAAWLGAALELELFCAADESSLQLQLLLDGTPQTTLSPASFALFCQTLQADLPNLRGAGAVIHPDAPRRTRRRMAEMTWGAPGLLIALGSRSYWVSRGAFFQVNRFLLPRLLEQVIAGQRGRLAWDLYSGVGLFSLVLAERFEQVVAVEGSPIAAADLAAVARQTPALQPHAESTLDFLRRAVTARERPDLVVLDPPRAGLGTEGAALLARVAPAAIVYVSCDPTTLARDLLILLAAGYTANSVALFDLFPQTFHLETVVHLQQTPPALV